MRSNILSVWNDERTANLVALQQRGWSCAQIAAELGNGITRNAVIGKLHRLGISGGASAMSEQERIRRAKAAVARKVERRRERRRELREAAVANMPVPRKAYVPLVCAEVEPRGISLLDLEPSDCRYPDGEGAGITFCGHPALLGRSYCGPHVLLTLDRARSPTRGEVEAHRRQRRAEFNQALLEAAE